ncbi:hypothetical protein PFISCL1PPCAC_27839, partial [Pristionchus fissidentatus]
GMHLGAVHLCLVWLPALVYCAFDEDIDVRLKELVGRIEKNALLRPQQIEGHAHTVVDYALAANYICPEDENVSYTLSYFLRMEELDHRNFKDPTDKRACNFTVRIDSVQLFRQRKGEFLEKIIVNQSKIHPTEADFSLYGFNRPEYENISIPYDKRHRVQPPLSPILDWTSTHNEHISSSQSMRSAVRLLTTLSGAFTHNETCNTRKDARKMVDTICDGSHNWTIHRRHMHEHRGTKIPILSSLMNLDRIIGDLMPNGEKPCPYTPFVRDRGTSGHPYEWEAAYAMENEFQSVLMIAESKHAVLHRHDIDIYGQPVTVSSRSDFLLKKLNKLNLRAHLEKRELDIITEKFRRREEEECEEALEDSFLSFIC